MKSGSSPFASTNFLILAVIFIVLAATNLFISFKGLNHPVAMDQAQIARQIARGEGMTTKYVRPIELSSLSKQAEKNAQKETAKIKKQSSPNNIDEDIDIQASLDINALPSTLYAPLNILANSIALNITGADDFEQWRMEKDRHIYGPDRIIAAISLLFFMGSLVVIYYLIGRLFDPTIAFTTTILLLLSNLFLQFSISGLPQMMMLFFFTLGINFLFSSIENNLQNKSFKAFLILAIICMSLVALSGWIGIWAVIGFLIFIGIYFKPYGLYSVLGLITLLLLSSWSIYHNYTSTGNPLGVAVYSIYQGIIGSDEGIMRSLSQNEIPFYPQGILSHIVGSSLNQAGKLILNMGGIIIVPFFFLAIFHPFKNKATNTIKWAVLIIWLCSSVGMALYADSNTELNSGQLLVLTAPLFAAYGMAIMLVMIARVVSNNPNLKGLKPLSIVLVVAISSGSFLMAISSTLKTGLASDNRGIPNWPPYLPLALNLPLHDETSANQVIVTDQPWAVAWYADRPSLWIPRKKDTFFALEDILKKHSSSVGGLLISPISHHTPGGVKGILSNYGDFAFFVMEGQWLSTYQPYGKYLISELQTNPTQDPLISRFAHARARIPLVGGDLIYYCENPRKK